LTVPKSFAKLAAGALEILHRVRDACRPPDDYLLVKISLAFVNILCFLSLT
jgi:hypothetical protein